MKRLSAASISFLAFAAGAQAQTPIRYDLRYSEAGAPAVSVTITLPEIAPSPASLVMPRNYPGGYEQVPYDSFVAGVAAFSADGKPVSASKDKDGPRWTIAAAESPSNALSTASTSHVWNRNS
ncbi:MAG: hypothetical protein WDO73_02520 [Ignavibacteriota bacterium]